MAIVDYSKETETEWRNRIERKLAGTPRRKENARFQMGLRTGERKRETEMLQILEFYQLIWWDESQQVWLNMTTGKPVYGLDWRETN